LKVEFGDGFISRNADDGRNFWMGKPSRMISPAEGMVLVKKAVMTVNKMAWPLSVN
jgi:hypothetical protein